jgi:hypothetical protein
MPPRAENLTLWRAAIPREPIPMNTTAEKYEFPGGNEKPTVMPTRSGVADRSKEYFARMRSSVTNQAHVTGTVKLFCTWSLQIPLVVGARSKACCHWPPSHACTRYT